MKEIFIFAKQVGWRIALIDEQQKMVRIIKDEIRLDVWSGKKGITVGFYENRRKAIYKKKVNREDLKELLVDTNYINKI